MGIPITPEDLFTTLDYFYAANPAYSPEGFAQKFRDEWGKWLPESTLALADEWVKSREATKKETTVDDTTPHQTDELQRIHDEMEALYQQQLKDISRLGLEADPEMPHMQADGLLEALVKCLVTDSTSARAQEILDTYAALVKWYA
jgi:hypothetical protein